MTCCANDCDNRSSSASSVHYFRFPLGDPDRLDQWYLKMRRQNWTPTSNSRLCSEHFESHHFSTDSRGRTRLKDTAVPTIFSFYEGKEKRSRRHINMLSAPEAPGQEEELARTRCATAGKRRQGTATEGEAGKTTAFPVLAEANRGEGMSGGTDDVLEGIPAYPAAEEEDEDWQFTLPKGTLEDDDNNEDDEDTGSARPTEESWKSGTGQQCENRAQVETAKEPANDFSPVSSDGAMEERSKEADTMQSSKEPAEAPPQTTVPDMPVLSIKDEPEDEGYNAALLPQSSISKIKEELEHKEEELRISSVFSFRGGNAFAPQGGPVPFTQPTTIFIPTRATLLQASAMPPLVIKPRLPVPALLPILQPQPLPQPQPQPQPQPHPQPQPQPQPQPAAICAIRCSGCSKVLVKGQTAFQRKGATQLFCSTVCLSSHLPPTSMARSCYQCNKEIDNPKSMVMLPLDNNTFMHFCSHFCLAASATDKKRTVAQLLYNTRLMPRVNKEKEALQCIMCKSSSRIEHEVTHQGHIHSLCSDACFLAWRKSRQLAMNCCEGCGLYCKSDSDVCQTLTVEKAKLHFCSPTCVGTYKQSCMKKTECAVCHASVAVSSTIMEPDPTGKVQLYCSTACMAQSGPAKHILTGTAFPCSHCSLSKVPQYHLATADGHIRNFCSYECVSVFRVKKGESIPQPNLVNGATSSPSYSSAQPPLADGPLAGPVGASGSHPSVPQPPALALGRAVPLGAYPSPHHSVTSVPPLEPSYSEPASHSEPASQAHLAPPSSPGHALTQAPPIRRLLTCHQCSKHFDAKPILFSYKGRISMFCGAACCEQYKAQQNIMAQCESCKLENVVFEVMTYNEQDRVFCSQSCKQQFQVEATTTGNKASWRPCAYCSCMSQKRLHSHYSGRVKEFCRPFCMSQYTVLFYGMARCDSCRTQGYMSEKLQCTSSVRNFCTQVCLLEYCYQHFEAGVPRSTSHAANGHALPPPHAPSQAHHPSKMNPVVGDVVSLASDSAARPHGSRALTGTPTSNTHDRMQNHASTASTQTDTLRLPVARRCQVKNKAVLCRPFTLDKNTMCQLPHAPAATTSDAATADPVERSPINSLPSRLTGRHFLDMMRGGGRTDCVVCGQHKRKKNVKDEREEERATGKRARLEEESGDVRVEETEEVDKQPEEKGEEEKEEKRRNEEEGAMKEDERGEASGPAQETACCAEQQTAYCCKTCVGRPALCPVPCFELYHTRLLYRFAAQLYTAVEHRQPCPQPNTASPLLPPLQTHADKANSGELWRPLNSGEHGAGELQGW